MQHDTKYGKLLYSCARGPEKVSRSKKLSGIGALFFVVVTVFLVSLGESDTDVIYAYAMITGLCALPFIIKFFSTNVLEAAVYENGFAYSWGKKVAEMHFNEAVGVQRGSAEPSIVAGGLLGILLFNMVSKLIPGLAGDTIEVVKKAGKKAEIGKGHVANIKEFSDELEKAFTGWLTKGLTMENIADADISFGDDLRLSGGKFIHDMGRKGKKSISLGEVRGVTRDSNGTCWITGAAMDKKGKPEKMAGGALNTLALCHIVQMIVDARARQNGSLSNGGGGPRPSKLVSPGRVS